MLPILKEPGGQFTDRQGNQTIHAPDAVATNFALTRWDSIQHMLVQKHQCIKGLILCRTRQFPIHHHVI